MSDFDDDIEAAKAITQEVMPSRWPGRCTVKDCLNIAGAAMTQNYGRERWARCNDHLGCDDDGKPYDK
jgi:hypothetical protein